MLLYLPTRLFWVYTIILISNTGKLHVYLERTIIRNTRVGQISIISKILENLKNHPILQCFSQIFETISISCTFKNQIQNNI